MKSKNTHSQLQENEIQIGDYFILNSKSKLGKGAFGVVYQGKNSRLNQEVAIKLESSKIKHPQLFSEGKLYSILQGGIGIPSLHWYGTQGHYNILIIDSLGPSLENLFIFCKRKFSLKTTLMLAEQILQRIEFVHSRYYIHRDVKPDNFLIGKGLNANTVYIIDFGLAKRFRDPRTGVHIPYKEGKSLTGTARYASINTHIGIEQARRDDVEAIGYIMVYFLRGELPWQGLKAKSKKEKYEKIKEKKIGMSLDDLCEGFPDEIKTWIDYTRNLNFEEKPNYGYLRGLIEVMANNNKIRFNNMNDFDWVVMEKMKKEKEKEKEEKKGNSASF